MKTARLFFLLLVTISSANGEPDLRNRGPILLKEIISQKWADEWNSASLENVRLVSQKADLDEPTGLPPVWSASIAGPEGKGGHLMWDSSGEGRLVEFSLDDKLVVKSDSAIAITGVPYLQEFPIKDEKGKPVASGCVPTAAASVVSYWAAKAYPQWRGDDGKTPKDIALRLRKKLQISLFPDLDGFSENRMALAGATPTDLYKVLEQEIALYKIPMGIGLGKFTFALLEKEINASRPALLSCTVRVVHKPELSWAHEVAAVGYCQIDGIKLVGVLDNFHPTKHEETIRWIRQDAFQSIVILRPDL